MVMRSIWMALLILRIMGAVISEGDDMKEEVEEDLRDYMNAKDYCSIDEFKNMDYYLFCDTQLHEGAGGFRMKPCIISSETQTIEEAKELYQEFREKLPLESEPDEEGEENNVTYVSPDCKWVITNKWNEYKTISTQTLFYKNEKVKETVGELPFTVEPILIVKKGDVYEEMGEESREKLLGLKEGSFTEGYRGSEILNGEGTLLAGITDDYGLFTIRRIEDGSILWSYPLFGIREEVRRIRKGMPDEEWRPCMEVVQFEGNEQEGWVILQGGMVSSFFMITYPSGEVTYLGEYLYSACFSPDGKYVAYSSIEYDTMYDMSWEEKKTIVPGIYVLEVETGKTAYIYWDPSKNPEEDFMEYRNFMWIEKEGFDEYMSDMRNKE